MEDAKVGSQQLQSSQQNINIWIMKTGETGERERERERETERQTSYNIDQSLRNGASNICWKQGILPNIAKGHANICYISGDK